MNDKLTEMWTVLEAHEPKRGYAEAWAAAREASAREASAREASAWAPEDAAARAAWAAAARAEEAAWAAARAAWAAQQAIDTIKREVKP